MQLRVNWKNGEIVLLEGADIADAFNNAGYTEEDISAIDNYYEYTPPNMEDQDYPVAIFNCPKCKGTISMHHFNERKGTNNFHTYQYICDDCDYKAPKATTELRATIAMNIYFCTNISPTISELNKVEKAYLKEIGEELTDELYNLN